VTRRYSYGAWHDGPDPLAAPYDVAEAIDAVGDGILDGADPGQALRDLLRRGAPGMRGLDDLLRQARERRRELRRSGRLDGTLEQVRELLDRAVEQERSALFPDPSDDARLREAELDTLPNDTSRAVRALSDYAWRSDEARATFDELRSVLRSEVLDQQFRGMKQALEQSASDPAAMEQVKDMLADLNAMLEADARGQHTQEQFDAFMDKHGDFFPSRPENLEQLVDELARRAAAASRLMDSLSDEQRQELSDLMSTAMQDMGLASEMSRLDQTLRARRPDLPWTGRERMQGDEPLGLGDATTALQELADLDELESTLAQEYAGASLEDVDEESVRRALGRSAVDDLERLRAMERELEQQGYLLRKGGRLELSPKAVRRIGQTALRRVFASLHAGTDGDHDVHDAGAAGEPTGGSRAWRFGDEQPLDVVRTVSNGVLRAGRVRAGEPVRLSVDDFEVQETERRTSAAVCLLVDQSFSMVINDTWRDAKSTALALHALVTSKFPQDAVQVIGFANMARVVPPGSLVELDVPGYQGTNLQHALMLAGRFVDKHPDADPVVLLITDGEPTAHITRDGSWSFDWPPSSETLSLTLAEVDRLTRRGATLSIFKLGDDPRLAAFVDEVARRNGGRVLSPSAERLGNYVVSDYLRARRARAGR
jgi:uncharacterized protein with von Willebrand factor type A (vWA) domain